MKKQSVEALLDAQVLFDLLLTRGWSETRLLEACQAALAVQRELRKQLATFHNARH